MSYNYAGPYSLCFTGLRDQRTNEAFLGCENHAHLRGFKGQTSVCGDLRYVHIWCGDGSMLGASLAGLSCEVPSSGWWCFPSSDVSCAFYQLFCPAHVRFMDLHLSFYDVCTWHCQDVAQTPFPSLGAVHSGCCPEASSFCSPLGAREQWSSAGPCLTFCRAASGRCELPHYWLRVRDILFFFFLNYELVGLLAEASYQLLYPTLTSETFFNKLLKSVVL